MLWVQVVNVLIPTEQYKINKYILTNTIGLGQFNESQDVCLLDVTQYENCTLSKNIYALSILELNHTGCDG